MKNKFILAVSSLFCLATFAVAQDMPEAEQSQPAPVETVVPEPVPAPAPAPAPAPEEQAAPAPEEAPAVSAPAPTQTTTQPVQSSETTPVIFYYANTVTPAQDQSQPEQNQAVAPAPVQQQQQPVPVQPYQPTVHPKQTMHYGIQASIGSSDYIGESNDDLDDGLTWNAGAFISIPISDYIFSLEMGSQFIYRKVSHSYSQTNRSTYENEARKDNVLAYSLGITPFQMNINTSRSGIVNFLVGIEMEVPLYNNLQISIDGVKRVDQNLHEDHCESISWDFILGMGINATKHFGIYTRMNIGMSNIYNDLYIRGENDQKEYWSFKAFDLSFGLKLFI